jgi:hypothetical protein
MLQGWLGDAETWGDAGMSEDVFSPEIQWFIFILLIKE